MDMTLSRPPAGQLLDGRYRVDSWLARGGMATVYLGTDTRLDRTVALKIAHPELAGDSEFVRRFIDEARSVARLSSPHVVAVYDQGCDADFLYLAMEYVPGRTLRDLLRASGRLSPHESLDIIEGVLAGLAAAHDAGIIHRDVKPENVLISSGGSVKVADFGLARAASAGDRTRTGMIIGTAAYLAPEQVSRSTSDARTDVYAAGVMLFEMLTGRQPHTGGSPLEVAHKHVSDSVPTPSSLVPGLPPALDALVALATSRDPDLRPADAGHFRSAVTEVRHGLPMPPAGQAGQHTAPGGQHTAPGGVGATAALEPPGYAPPAYSKHASAEYARSGLARLGLAPPEPVQPAEFPVPGSVLDPAALSAPPEAFRPPEAFPAPGSGGYPPAIGSGHDDSNHTLIVPTGHEALDGFPPLAGRPGGGGRYRGRGEPRLQRWLFSRRLAYLAAALAVIVVIALVGWWVTSGRYGEVPQLQGMAASTARAELANLGFTVRVGPGKHSDLPKGEIVATSPAAGVRAAHGSAVTIIESLGPVMIQVPQVTGLALQDAVAALRKSGLTPGRVTTSASPTIQAGVVVSTNPVAGTSWPRTKPVAITVSAGPPLPSFVGQQLQQAQATATAGGYLLNPVTVSNSAPQGTILRQSPAPGTPITPHEVVTVRVSAGPPLVPVPAVRGMTVQQATRVLEQAGFQVHVNQGLGYRVASYTPTGQAPRGSTITINVGFTFP